MNEEWIASVRRAKLSRQKKPARARAPPKVALSNDQVRFKVPKETAADRLRRLEDASARRMRAINEKIKEEMEHGSKERIE